ncbi:hypothetical protein L1049_002819 [Liquidambar formosana]|uniref:Late embryogenesis abundant protein LEA-2 subgroup domain-containing protein n=1 Tax=Liquidambar formosana TaxID=63359 RepID=A0AAP0R9E3_LIQFO
MEERVPSATTDAAKDDPPLPPLKPPPGHPSETNDDPPLPSLKRPHGHRSGTYVVQVPKDQIYRVPPPENALIAERYRNPATKRSQSCCCSRCLCVFIIILVLLVLTVGILLGAFYLYLSPKNPEFSIAGVVVKNRQSSSRQHSQPRYEISLKAKNPNKRMGVYYQGGGGASLAFKKQKIATGKFPALHQEAEHSSTVKVVLTGSDAALPLEIEKSMKDEKSKVPVSLALTMNVPVKMIIWMMKTWSMDMAVSCNFRVSTLAKGTRVLSQQCQTQVQS